MTDLYLIRHGQTDWNIAGRYQGQSDIPLNTAGLEQANALARQLSGQYFDALFSSDLQRAYQTAVIVGQALGLPVQVRRALREICMGAWEGCLLAEVSQTYAQDRTPDSRAPGGESVSEVAARMALSADEMALAHPYGRVLVISHGLALATLVCQARSIPLHCVYDHIPGNAQPSLITWHSR